MSAYPYSGEKYPQDDVHINDLLNLNTRSFPMLPQVLSIRYRGRPVRTEGSAMSSTKFSAGLELTRASATGWPGGIGLQRSGSLDPGSRQIIRSGDQIMNGCTLLTRLLPIDYRSFAVYFWCCLPLGLLFA